MFGWLRHLLPHARHEVEHEPEVQIAQREQRQKFDAWESTMAEVARVQKLAEKRQRDAHR